VRRFVLPLFVLVLAASARGEDWPQFLGPRRDGTSKETIAPWKEAPKVLWRANVGEGHSSPVVANGLVFLHARDAGDNAERLSIYDAVKGNLLASASHPRADFKSPFGAGPRATPTIVGDRVYTYGVTGRLTAYQVIRGDKVELKELFSKELLAEFKAKNLTFGVSASPLVEGDAVIVLVGGSGHGIVAFNRNTGDVMWKALDDPASYSSPVVLGEGEKRQIVALTQKGLAGLAPKDGAVLWQHPFQDRLNESSTSPVMAGDLLIGSSVTLGSVALKPGESDGKPAAEPAWMRKELNCYFSTPVPAGKHLYLVSGVLALRPSITLRCVEIATGKTLWSKPTVGKYHAALTRTADDKLLMLDDGGSLTLIQPDGKEYKELARSKVCGETWAHPALADGKIYLRDAKELICLELGK